MPRIETYVEFDLDDVEDNDLVLELQSRGYAVTKTAEAGGPPHPASFRSPVDEAAWRLQRGEVEDALHLIGRSLGGPFLDLPEAVRRASPPHVGGQP